MTPSKRKDAAAREARQRARSWNAKQTLHAEILTRRRRDNILGSALVVAAIAIAVLSTTAYYTAGPGGAGAASSSAVGSSSAVAEESNSGDVPSATIAAGRDWSGSMNVNGQQVSFTLDGADAPQAVSSFVSLVQSGFYEGLTCHRLVDQDDFHILQCGDPNGDGTGGPGYSYGPIENAPSDDVYTEGTIAMARTTDDAYSMGSQFFIVFGDSTIPSDTAGGYTVIGHIDSGLDVITDIAAQGTASDSTEPAENVELSDVTVQ